jgi:hypothetical protein
MASEIEEVVFDSEIISVQDLAPDGCESLFDFVAGGEWTGFSSPDALFGRR